MQSLKKELLENLELIKGNGSFITSHVSSFVFPGLVIEKLGEIAYPINELQAKALIQVANSAPFGKGSQTIVDKSVRSAWEIDSSKIQFKGDKWDSFLQRVLKNIKPQLGLEDYEVEAKLYKMLVYEKGDFFLPHRDSEKEKGMFGTLIIGLPSLHSGGELLVRFDGVEKIISFAGPEKTHNIPYVAFYADCEHEIKPLEEGFRVCLTYNLIQKKSNKEIKAESLGEHVARLASVLKEGEDSRTFFPGILLLGHQYTPENFSIEQLKLNDRSKTEAMLRAADKAGYYAKMCLVTSHLSGIPSYNGYGYDEDPDENATMDEVYEEELYIENWLENDTLPPLRSVKFEEKDLLVTFQLNEDEPIVKESTGYMGNYGPDLLHWYHYGAVFFWPKKFHTEILLSQNLANQFEWIAYYNTVRKQLSAHEILTCENILMASQQADEARSSINFNVIADWLIGYEDDSCLEKLGNSLLESHFEKISEASWVKLFEAYSPSLFEKILDQVISNGRISALWHLLFIYKDLADTSSARNFTALQMPILSKYFGIVKELNQAKVLVNDKALSCLLELENKFPQEKNWVNFMLGLLTDNKERKYVNNVVVKVALALEKKRVLAKALLLFGRGELVKRVNNVPKPPENWTRSVPDPGGSDKRQWKLLESFLQSPGERVFDYKINQQERSEMEAAISKVTIDLQCETIRKGSPHILRIHKTQDAYENQMREWRQDKALLETVNKKISENT